MSRVIDSQANPWGRYQGVEAQRTDLWTVDFTTALTGLRSKSIMYIPPKLANYYPQSVILPELKIKAEPVRRASRSYNMPSWDEPLEGVQMTFLVDCYQNGQTLSPYTSDIYRILDAWRSAVRSGRGSVSQEPVVVLNESYRADYAFDVELSLLRGGDNSQNWSASDAQVSMRFFLAKCWLGAFKLGELNYDTAKALTIQATFYAEDIRQAG